MSYSYESEEKRRVDFMPGELIYLIEHEQPYGSEELRARLLQYELTNEDERLRPAIESARGERVLRFERPTEEVDEPGWFANLLLWLLRFRYPLANLGRVERPARYYSLYFTTIRADGNPLPDDDLIELVQRLDRWLVGQGFNQQRSRFDQDWRMRPDSSDTSKAAKTNTSEPPEFAVMAVCPNWMVSGTQSQTLVGGPGGLPERTKGVPNHDFTFVGAQKLRPVESESAGGVDVFVLDTIPTRIGNDNSDRRAAVDVLRKAYDQWVGSVRVEADKHPILKTLLEPDVTGFKRLRVIPSAVVRDDGSSLIDYLNDHDTGVDIVDHEYYMGDHGLFAAGIIHSIIPEANIYLVQVLNKYGVGTLESLLYGLSQVIAYKSRNPVVVNLSLTLAVPQPDHISSTDSDVTRAIEAEMATTPDFIERQMWCLKWLFDLLAENGVSAVAAAGNDSQPSARLEARFPASLESVLGISALGGVVNTPADYANLADDPIIQGLATFGGDATFVSNGGQRVAGVYIGDFPDGEPSENGWAYWSGSSFATPIISGRLAQRRANGDNRVLALDNIRDISPALTNDNEEIVRARQV